MVISTAPDPAVHYPSAVVGKNVVGYQLCHRVPVAGCEVLPKALAHLACRVFQSRRLRLQFVKAGERGVKVCLVEELEPGDQVAFKCEKGDLAPFESEALL